MPEAVERPLDKYLQKYDEHYKRVVPDWYLQYRTAEQQYLYEGDFSVFVRELTDEGAIVQDSVTGILGFAPESEFGRLSPQLGDFIDGARCTSMDYTVLESPSVEVMRTQTGIVWEWDEQAGEGYILPSEEQEAWKMLRVFRRDIDWHDSYRLFVGQFVQFETALCDEVPIEPNDERAASFALRVRSPEVIFSLRRAAPRGPVPELHAHEAQDADVDPALESSALSDKDAAIARYEDEGGQMLTEISARSPALTMNPRKWRRDAPIQPESGRPQAMGGAQQGAVGHPALARWADSGATAARAESPAWLWDEKLGYFEEDLEDYPIIPLEILKPRKMRLVTRIFPHEVAVERGESWKEPAQRQGRKDWQKQRPPGRAIQEKMALKKKAERELKRKQARRDRLLRAASLRRGQNA